MVKERLEQEKLLIELSGRIETSNAPEEGARIFEIRASYLDKDLELDAKDLTYISSAGLRELLKLYKQEKHLSITHVSKEVYDIFDITGFTDFLDIQMDKEAESEAPCEGINNTYYDAPFVPAARMFERQAKEHPDKAAIVSTERSLTYRELDAESNRIANMLQYIGVRPDDLIMVLLPRSVDVCIANLGIMKAGAAFLVANTEYPDERIAFMYENAACKYLITTHEICFDRLDLIIEIRKRPLFFENSVTFLDTGNTKQRIDERDLAYCIYTSGSTGKPKGVLIEQENLTNFLDANPKNHEIMEIIGRASVVLSLAPQTFDVSIMEMFVPLTAGLTMALASDEEIRNPMLLRNFMEAQKVDAMISTPSFLETLIALPGMKDALKQIKVYDIGAEAFPAPLFDMIRAINPDALVMNGYGPTETTISCTVKVIEDSDHITIGTPGANVKAYVVDKNNEEVPDGTEGELLIAGKGVGRGYIGLPQKTAEVFIDFNGQRAYKTGDIVRITEDGEIEYRGRDDHQVKLHGLRIELGEIEEILSKCEGVSRGVALVIDNRYLAYYYVTDKEVSPDEVKEFAGKHLAHYMVPSFFIPMDIIPLTANMKIDRKALPKPEIREENLCMPETEMQKKLYDLVKEVLPSTEIGIDTNLFDTGISSLESMMILTVIGDEFRIVLKLSDLQEHPTIRAMEKILEMAAPQKRRRKKDRYRCTFIQQSLYGGMKKGNSAVHSIPVILTLDPSVDEERLMSAVTKTVENHPGLSAAFTAEGDNIYQIPRKEVIDGFRPEVIDLTDQEFEGIREELANTQILLSDPLMFQVRLYRTESRRILFAVFSHLISDGDSVDIFFGDVAAAYQGKKLKKERMSMFEVGEEYMAYMDSPLYAQTIGYYRRLMSGRTGFTSIPDTIGDEELSAGFAVKKLSLNKSGLQERCRQLGLTENALITGVIGIVLSEAAGEKGAAFAVGYNGRNDSRLSNTFGCIANLLLINCHSEGESLEKAYFEDLQKQLFEAMSFTMVPFGEMAMSYEHFLEIVFVNQLCENEEIMVEGKKHEVEFLTERSMSELHRIVLQTYYEGEEICVSADYHANRYEHAQIEELLLHIDQMLQLTGDMKDE